MQPPLTSLTTTATTVDRGEVALKTQNNRRTIEDGSLISARRTVDRGKGDGVVQDAVVLSGGWHHVATRGGSLENKEQEMTYVESASVLINDTARTEFALPSPIKQPDSAHDKAEWRLATRIAFRFVFAYFVLYAFPYQAPLERVVPWLGSHILHLSHTITVFPNGSGDTTYNYVEVLCFLAVAAVAALTWSLLDRKRAKYERLFQWLRLGIRLVLGMTMLGYGAAKVMQGQMPAPSLSRLLQPYGESSPMGLLWTFIGASGPYQIFCGASEMLGGILLFVPWLTALGSLVCVGVLTNVFVLNMCYDVPVKLFSLHLLLMAVFLAAPDLRKLADLFIFQRPARLSHPVPLFRRRWLNRTVLAVQLLCGVALASVTLYFSHQQAKEMAVKPPYYGIWSVEEYAVDGNPQPLVLTNATRWRRVLLDSPERLSVQPIDGPQERFMLKLDQSKKSFTLTKRADPNWKADFYYRDGEKDVLLLEGELDSHKVSAKLHRVNESEVLLTSRGFHWINEYPFNR